MARARPKVERTWRWFAAEYAVVFVGVLTALGAQQLAETLNQRREANEARQAIKAELAFNLAGFDLMVSQIPCSNRRLDELDRWLLSLQTGAPLKLARPLRGPSARIFRTSVWEVASAEGVARMPFKERVAFGQFYDGLENNGNFRQQMATIWRELGEYDLNSPLDREEVSEIRRKVVRLRQLNEAVAGNAAFVRGYAKEVGVTPARISDAAETARTREFCAPLLQAG